MYTYLIPITIGGIVGFGLFIKNLESPEMKGVLYRPDDENNMRFNPAGVRAYLIEPFRSSILWNRDLLPTNWVFMTTVGALSCLCLSVIALNL